MPPGGKAVMSAQGIDLERRSASAQRDSSRAALDTPAPLNPRPAAGATSHRRRPAAGAGLRAWAETPPLSEWTIRSGPRLGRKPRRWREGLLPPGMVYQAN